MPIREKFEKDNTPNYKMLPPSRVYIPGTDEYERALRSGEIFSSIVSSKETTSGGLSTMRSREEPQPPIRANDNTVRVISPDNQGNKIVFIHEESMPKVAVSSLSSFLEDGGSEENAGLAEVSKSNETAVFYSTNNLSHSSVDLKPHESGHKRRAPGGHERNSTNNHDDQHDEVMDRDEYHCSPPAPKKLQPSFEQTRFSDIIGHAAVKLRIDEMLLPLTLPPDVTDLVLSGIRAQPASILLYGPPGCGKTKLAQAIAGEAQAAFFSITPSDVLSKFVGESEAAIRSVFRRASDVAAQLDSKCAVVFFDEIDALGQTRENKGSGEGEGCSRRVLAQLLMQFNTSLENANKASTEESSQIATEYDEKPPRVFVVAATNRPEDCDSALLRRFAVRLHVGPPSLSDRRKMLVRHLRGIQHNLSECDLRDVASITDCFSGSDIESLSREAAFAPVREIVRTAAIHRRRRGQRKHLKTNLDEESDERQLAESFRNMRPVTIGDFQAAISVVTQGELVFSSQTEAKSHEARHLNHYDSSSDEEDFA